MTSESQVERTISNIVSDFGQIDVLVTAAGIVDNAPAEEYSYERWRKMLDINLDGTFLCAREVGKHMIEKNVKGGSIVLVGSICGSVCVKPQKQSAYNAVCPSSPFVCFGWGILRSFYRVKERL